MKNLQLTIISVLFFTGLFGLSLGYAQQPNVTITGKTYNESTNGVMMYSNLTKLGRPIYHGLSVKADSTFELKFYLPEASEVTFNHMTVLCTPGDSVDVVIRGTDYRPIMEFTGRGSSIYNFMNDLEQLNRKNRAANLVKPIGETEASEALEVRQQRYKQSSELFEDYVSRHHPSEEIKAYAYSKIYFEYLSVVNYVIDESGPQKDSLTAKYLNPLEPAVLANDLYLHSRRYLNFMKYMIEEQWAPPLADETAAHVNRQQKVDTLI